jgi:hypothetical protein
VGKVYAGGQRGVHVVGKVYAGGQRGVHVVGKVCAGGQRLRGVRSLDAGASVGRCWTTNR